MEYLEGPRIFLRHFEEADLSRLVRLFSNPEVMEYSSGVKNQDQVEEWLYKCLSNYKRSKKNLYAIVENGANNAIGYCGHLEFEDVGGKPETEIGYRLLPEKWGIGYATEAAKIVRDYGFNELSLKRQISIIEPTNIRSVRVAKKIGMSYEKDVLMPWYTKPDHVYSIER
ncbi:MAG: GNAT family N-acetyltransferase [Gammaproteobacteria bacterium]|nr:GNAT family N-acetyltransferase [Gammaproteobacteria bacterium]